MPRSPFALRAELHGPQTPRDKVVFCITAALGIVLSLTIVTGAWIALP